MRRRREKGTLASILPILVLVGLAQGVGAKHDGERYHRRSRTRGPMERQVGLDVGLLGSDLLSVELLASLTSTSTSLSSSAESSVTQTSSAAFAAAAVASSSSSVSSVTPTSSAISSVSASGSIAEPSSSASTSSSSDAGSSSSASSNLFSLNAALPSPTISSLSASASSSTTSVANSESAPTSSFTTGGYVRPNTPAPGQTGVNPTVPAVPSVPPPVPATPSAELPASAIPSAQPPAPAVPSAEPPALPIPSVPPPGPASPSVPPPGPALPSGQPPVPAIPSDPPPVPAMPSAQPPAPAIPSTQTPVPPIPSDPPPAPAIPSIPPPASAIPSTQPPIPPIPSDPPPAPAMPSLPPPVSPIPSAQPPVPAVPSAQSPTPSVQPPAPSLPPPAGPTSVPSPPAVPSAPIPGQPMPSVVSDPYKDDNGFSAPPRPTVLPPSLSQDTAWQFGGFSGISGAGVTLGPPEQPVPSITQPQQQLTTVIPPQQQPSSLAPTPSQPTSNLPQQPSFSAPPQQLPTSLPLPPQVSSDAAPSQALPSVNSQLPPSGVPPQQPSSGIVPQQQTTLAPPPGVSSSVTPSQPPTLVLPFAQATSARSAAQTSLGLPVAQSSLLPGGLDQSGTSVTPIPNGPVIPSTFAQPSGPIPGSSSVPNAPVSGGTGTAGLSTTTVPPGPVQPTSPPLASSIAAVQPSTSVLGGPTGQTSLPGATFGGPSSSVTAAGVQTSVTAGLVSSGIPAAGSPIFSALPSDFIPNSAPSVSTTNTNLPSSVPPLPASGILTSLLGTGVPSGLPSLPQKPFTITQAQPGAITATQPSIGLLSTSGNLPSNPLPSLSPIPTSLTPILPFTGQPFPLVSSLPIPNPQNSKTNAISAGQPSATSHPVISEEVSASIQPSGSGVGGQVISASAIFSSAAVIVPSAPANSDASVDSRPPTTLIGATQSVDVVVPGASEAVSSSVGGIPIPVETSTLAQAPIVTAQPSSSGVSVDFKPPTTLLPSASNVNQPVQSLPAQVVPSSSVSMVQPTTITAPAVELPVVSSSRPPVPSAIESAPFVSSPAVSSSIPFEAPSVVAEAPSSTTTASSNRVDAPPTPTFPPAQTSDSSAVRTSTSTSPEVTFQPPAPSSSSRIEPETPAAPKSSSAQVPEPSSQSHSTSHEPTPSEVFVQPSTPPSSESTSTSTPVRSQESSSVNLRPSSSDVGTQPSTPAASDAAPTSSFERPNGSSSHDARPSVSSASASASLVAVPDVSGSSAARSALSSSASIAIPSPSDVASSSTSSEAWAAPTTSKSSSKEDIYVPTQTWLIMATGSPSASLSSVSISTTDRFSQTGSSTTTQLPSTAVIPNSVPTLIVPANSAANKQYAGTGSDEDPLKDTTLISLLLAADQYPWTFVVKSADATSQLFNTFPKLVSGALQVPESDVQTYGLQVYQPASWNGDQASLLTQWLAYIPDDKFEELNAYLKAGLASNSPLFNQTGIQGALAAQINTAFPLAANSETAPTTTSTKDSDNDDTRTRDIIIGVCVGIGGLLWIALVFWIYKRIKRNNDRAVHKRLSEHMSMFDEREREQRRFSTAPSLAPSDIDDRPSSFYASPLENDPVFRRQQRRSLDGDSGRYDGSFVGSGSGHGDHSPTYHPSVFGQSWFANPQGQQMRQTQPQNPFEDIVTRSYLNTSGSAKGMSGMAQRRSGPGRPVHKAMIGQPTLHASSLEFREQ